MTVLKGSSLLAFPPFRTPEDAIVADLAADTMNNQEIIKELNHGKPIPDGAYANIGPSCDIPAGLIRCRA